MTFLESNAWAWASDGEKSSDAVYQVDVEQTAIGSGAFGLLFGADSAVSAKTFYAFVIDANTNFAIFRHTSADTWETVMDWRSSSMLNTGEGLNHLMLVRSGPMIAVYANGFILTSAVYDNNIQGTNYAGLVAWSNDTAGLQATFDNYSVCPLTEMYPMPVYVGLEDTVSMPAGQPVMLHMGWLATSRSLAKQFVDVAEFTLTIDGKEYTGFQEYWGQAMPYPGGYGVEWNLPLDTLPSGLHRIEYKLSLSAQITDGFDLDGNGKLDQYGPGVIYTGWAQINVLK